MAVLSPEDALVKSRVKLLMDYPFFGQLALYLKLVERKDIPTGATDGKNYFYNPKFVSSLTEPEQNFLTAHEVLHPALGHLWRKGSRDHIIWNHATDYVINAMILEADPNQNDFKLIKGCLYNKKFEGMDSEQVYDILIKDPDYVKKAHQMAQMAGGGGGGGTPSDGDPFGTGGTLDSHDVWEEKDGSGSGKDGEEGSGASGNQVEDWQGRVVQAAQASQGKGKGKLPALIQRMIKDLVAPQKNWRELIAEMIQFEVNDYGFTPPDRRMYGMSDYYGSDVIIPDFSEVEDVVKNLVFAVDTSGSIGEREFKVFISEIVGCLAQFGGRVKGKLIYCDAGIPEGGIYELEDAAHSLPRGGGGTDFRPVFEWVEENMEDCAGVAYLTDLFGSFPDKEPNYPVLWVATSNATPPWGRVTELKI